MTSSHPSNPPREDVRRSSALTQSLPLKHFPTRREESIERRFVLKLGRNRVDQLFECFVRMFVSKIIDLSYEMAKDAAYCSRLSLEICVFNNSISLIKSF